MDSAVESVHDENEISSFASNVNWQQTQTNNNASNSTLLFIAVEYVKDNHSSDYKFETDSSFSPQPSTYSSEFDQHVSPLDPNMSSTARYSPVYSEEPVSTRSGASTGYSTPVVVPLMTTELEGGAPATADSCFQDIADADTQLLRQVVGNRYLQMVTSSGQMEGESDENTGGVSIDYNQRSPEVDEQIMNKELQLVQFPINNYQQQLSIVERNMKVDPDQVELLITDQNTGISYSYVPQDFLVSRTPLPSLPEDEQQLNNVLNTLESHGLVMETNDDTDINEVSVQNSSLNISDGQMMLQDPLLISDSDLLLQAPVEIALDDNVLSVPPPLVLKPELPPSNHLIPSEVLNTSPRIEQDTGEIISGKYDVTGVKQENMEYDEANVKSEFEAQQLRRSRRQNDRPSLDDDTLILNRVQSISDKPVPSRARATLPEHYLVINKISGVTPDAEPEHGVFARKAIAKRTQFGPLEGVLLDTPLNLDETDVLSNELKLFLESETGAMHKLDISDENNSNWMRFVRCAKNFTEQNCILSQQGYNLYFTTTRAILPRQELQVGYCSTYAAKRKLPTLQPTSEDENTWPCFECPQKFTSSEDLQKHLNVHDENKEESLKKNVKKLGRLKRRPIDCPHCSRTFLRRQSLSRHLLQHNPSARERQVRYIRRLNVCTENIDKTLEWKCDICAIYFPTPSLLNLHELVHQNRNNETITGLPLDLGSGCNEGEFLVHSGAVQCPECGNEYSSRESLIDHVVEHGRKHPMYQENIEEIPKKGFKCYMCYKAFASRDRLQRHMLVHGSEESKPLKCDTCSKRFLNNSALSCHLKTHKLDKKIFECPICKISFDQILLLREHVRCHCIDGIYTCPVCSKIFKEYSIIRKHIRAFHCERKHGCQYCGKPFPTLDKLRMHLLKHSDHREFLCSECGKQFKRKDKLKEHMKRMHSEDREPTKVTSSAAKSKNNSLGGSGGNLKKFMPKVQPTDYHRFIYKCHSCLLGFKRRGMLVNHLAKRHPDISPDSVPELNLPILKTTRDYYCQYCDKVYKSSSKRKAHILKNHPGLELPMSNRRKGGFPDIPGVPNPTFSQTVGSVTTNPHSCQWCHKQYASKAKLLQHQRKKHQDMLPTAQKQPRQVAKIVGQQILQQQPQSPGIPEDSKLMNSPDIPETAVGPAVLPDDVMHEVSDDHLSVFTNNSYIHCEDTKIGLTANTIKQNYKLAEESLLNQAVEDFEECRGPNGQYYRLIQMSSGQLMNQSEESIDDPPEPSRLYRLLTANGPFQPCPPR